MVGVKFWVCVVFVWLLWISYARDLITPYLQSVLGPTVGYIASCATIFVGGWLLWKIVLK